MNRRQFIKTTLKSGLVVCSLPLVGKAYESNRKTVILYDTYAMAMYFDGTTGPKTGIMKVDYVINNEPVEMEFWHGHGGKSHFYTMMPENFDDIKQLKKTYMMTTEVADHSHKLFIDPTNPKYRVPGAEGVEVEVEDFGF